MEIQISASSGCMKNAVKNQDSGIEYDILSVSFVLN
jgi:hypothetical protein